MAAIQTAGIIVAAFALDLALGDPQNALHPMRLIGGFISLGTAAIKKARLKSPLALFVAGMLLTLLTIGLSYALTRAALWGLYRANYWLGLAIETLLCYFLIAAKALKDESMKVYRCVVAGELAGARENLSRIVGRDTKDLGFPAIIKAAVETVAENLSDGVIAPLIFICIGGAPLGMAYKALNTLDSMIGYKNEEFAYTGKFAARLDDIANLIPSRVSALMLLLGSVFTGADAKRAARVFLRDRYNHKSPNSAQTESVCAGALGLCLGGDSTYQGVLVHKPTIGDDIFEPAPKHILAANRLMYAAAAATIALIAASSLAIALWGRYGNG